MTIKYWCLDKWVKQKKKYREKLCKEFVDTENAHYVMLESQKFSFLSFFNSIAVETIFWF